MRLRCIRGYQDRRVRAVEGDVVEVAEDLGGWLLATECFEVVVEDAVVEDVVVEDATPKRKGRR